MGKPDYQYKDIQLCVIRGEEPDESEFRPGTALFFYQEPTNPFDDKAVRIENARGIKAGYFYRGTLQDMANDFISNGGKLVGSVVSYDGVTMIARIDFYRDGRQATRQSVPPRKAQSAKQKSDPAYGGKISTAISILSFVGAIAIGTTETALGGLFLGAAGLLINPAVRKSYKIPRIVAIIGYLILFLLYSSAVPSSVDNNQANGGEGSAESSVVEVADTNTEKESNQEEPKDSDSSENDSEAEESDNNSQYLKSVSWAALDNFKCAVERDDYSGDVLTAGTYSVTTSSTKLFKKDVPIVWDIYVSDNSYDNISELDDAELVATVGGIYDNGAEITVKKGKYLYIKYNEPVGNPIGMVELKLMSE